MRSPLVALLLAAGLLAGCAARGDPDPFAYARKPLYANGFDLAKGASTQQFWVTDGSIGEVVVHVWMNATSGGARVQLADPSGRTVMDVTESTQQGFPLNLGAWKLAVEPTAGAVGQVDVLVVRR